MSFTTDCNVLSSFHQFIQSLTETSDHARYAALAFNYVHPHISTGHIIITASVLDVYWQLYKDKRNIIVHALGNDRSPEITVL